MQSNGNNILVSDLIERVLDGGISIGDASRDSSNDEVRDSNHSLSFLNLNYGYHLWGESANINALREEIAELEAELERELQTGGPNVNILLQQLAARKARLWNMEES